MWETVRASIAMAHELIREVVAEGIEDSKTYDLLKTVSCDIGQGYHFSRPLAHGDLLTWNKAWSTQGAKAA